MARSKSLIVGAGTLEKCFYDYLLDLNHDVVTLSKSEKCWAKNPHCEDLFSPELNLSNLPKLDYLFIVLTPSQSNEDAYQRIYLEAIKNLIIALHLNQSGFHCVFISSISVYGSERKGMINEITVAAPGNFRSEVLLQAENALKVLHPSVSIVRAAGLYSNKRQKLIDSLLDKNKVNDSKYLNLIHEDDLCQWIWQVAKNKWPLSIAADGKPFQRRDLLGKAIHKTTDSTRTFQSQYLPQIQLKYSSFLQWLTSQ